MRKPKATEISVEEAKRRLRTAMERATPLRLIEENPAKALTTALMLGATLGFSRIARRGLSLVTDLALLSSGRFIARALEGIDGNREPEHR